MQHSTPTSIVDETFQAHVEPTNGDWERLSKFDSHNLYSLAHTVRDKLLQEAAKADQDLRRLVCHANLLDSLCIELSNTSSEIVESYEDRGEEWYEGDVGQIEDKCESDGDSDDSDNSDDSNDSHNSHNSHDSNSEPDEDLRLDSDSDSNIFLTSTEISTYQAKANDSRVLWVVPQDNIITQLSNWKVESNYSWMCKSRHIITSFVSAD
ncbi:hypothetical protein E5D57_008233 [Metarhizium anisopliae]|nr:hypothetical protein E5D57_008233 [Metarhizium anisopliae]